MRESSTAAVLNGKGEILLQLRSDVPIWALPGGSVEEGETPEEAAVREILEETGLNVKISRYVGKYVVRHLLYGDLTYVFVCRIRGGQLRKNIESLKLGFFSRENLPRPLLSLHGGRIDDVFSGRRNVDKLQRVSVLGIIREIGFNPVLFLRFWPWLCTFVFARSLQKIFK